MYLKLSTQNTTGSRDAQNGWVVGCGGVKKRWTFAGEERELSLAPKRYFRVYLGVKACEDLCFVVIISVGSVLLTSLFSLFYIAVEC